MTHICTVKGCGKLLKSKKSLEAHIAKFHSVEPPPAAAEDLDLETGEIPSTPGDRKYQCGDCGADIDRTMTTCPKCGEALSWEGI